MASLRTGASNAATLREKERGCGLGAKAQIREHVISYFKVAVGTDSAIRAESRHDDHNDRNEGAWEIWTR